MMPTTGSRTRSRSGSRWRMTDERLQKMNKALGREVHPKTKCIYRW